MTYLQMFQDKKRPLTPTRNRVYSRIYRQVLSKTHGDREAARSEAMAEVNRQGL